MYINNRGGRHIESMFIEPMMDASLYINRIDSMGSELHPVRQKKKKSQVFSRRPTNTPIQGRNY